MAVDMFFKIDGIKGESTDGHGHKQEIDVLAWSWGATQSGSTHHGPGGGSGKVNVQDLSFTKHIDTATTVLLDHVCTGKHIKSATLVVRKAGGKAPIEYLKIHLEDIIVSSVSTGGSGGEDRLTENVTLNFARFKTDYTPQKADGTADATRTAGFDVQQNKTIG